jgi:hypothetical protein
MTGPVRVGNATGPTVIASHPSGPSAVMVTPSSGVYSAQYPVPQKSRLGLVIAILAVLAVGGGVAAYVVVSNGNHRGGQGSGSQIAGSDGRGSGVAGGDIVRDAAVVAAVDAAGSGSDVAGGDLGSGHGSGVTVENPGGLDAGSNAPPPAEVVDVLLSVKNVARFEVFENGTKLFDGPDVLPVPKGETRSVVIKAAGYKDKVLVVDTAKRKLVIALARAPFVPPIGPHNGQGSAAGSNAGSGSVPSNAGSGAGSGTHVNDGQGSGHIYTPQLGQDCTKKILDPKSKACVEQYCAKHQDEDKCHME